MSETQPFELIINAPDDGLNQQAKVNRQLLLDAYKAQLTGDTESLFRLLADDVTFIEADSLPYGGTFHGPAGAQQGVGGMFTAWSHLRVEIEDILASGDLVIVYLQMTATSRETGEVYDGPTAELFRFKDGKITEWRPIYWDTHAVRKVCGLGPVKNN